MAGRKGGRSFGKAALLGLGAAALAAGAAMAYLMYLEYVEQEEDCRGFLKAKGPLRRSKEILDRFRDSCREDDCCCCGMDEDFIDEDLTEFEEDDFITAQDDE